jgi:hypothetical protein
MTTDQYIKKIRRSIQVLKTGIPIGVASQDTHVKMVERIFEKGKNALDSQIGQYNDSKPLYVNPDKSPKKFSTKGANGKSKFKNGKTKKTGYFKSYKDYRQKIGRPTGKVNLVLSGNLQSDFGKAVTKVNNLKYTATAREENEDKISGLEEKYGNIFRITPKERTNFKQVLSDELIKLLK